MTYQDYFDPIYQEYFDAAYKAGFSGGSALTIAAIAETQAKGGAFDMKHAYSESLGGTVFSGYPAYKSGSYVQHMPNHRGWVPWNSANVNAPKPQTQIDPETGKLFQVNTKNEPTANNKNLGKPISSSSPSWIDQTKKDISDYASTYPEAAQSAYKAVTAPGKAAQSAYNAVTAPGGVFGGLKNVPMRILKGLIGILLIGGSIVLIMIPPAVAVAKQTVVPELKAIPNSHIKAGARMLQKFHAKPPKVTKSGKEVP